MNNLEANNNLYAGLDVGSRTTKLVVYNGAVCETQIIPTGVTPLERCRELLNGRIFQRLVVTGYGRHLVAPVLGAEVITEIKAFAAGARYLVPECHTVIDVGGQDSKVILLTDKGDIQKFEMNDRCAAGTGKFLEIMASTLEVNIADFGRLAMDSAKVIRINSLCTVFAESEVVSLIAKGEEPAAIAFALHDAIATRLAAMIRRTGVREKVVFAGGGSYNLCLRRLLEQELETRLTVPESPQAVGALGAALVAAGGII